MEKLPLEIRNRIYRDFVDLQVHCLANLISSIRVFHPYFVRNGKIYGKFKAIRITNGICGRE